MKNKKHDKAWRDALVGTVIYAVGGVGAGYFEWYFLMATCGTLAVLRMWPYLFGTKIEENKDQNKG